MDPQNALELPEDFLSIALPKIARSNGPIYHLWVFNPVDGKVTVESPEEKPRAQHRYHKELAEDIPHPDRVHGYAYPIEGGYRITDWEHRPVEDRYIKHQVTKTLDNRSYQRKDNPSYHAARVLRFVQSSRENSVDRTVYPARDR